MRLLARSVLSVSCIALGSSVGCERYSDATAANHKTALGAPHAGAGTASSAPSINPATRALTQQGLVLGLDGKPAQGVLVQAYLLGNNSAGVMGNNGGALISDAGSSLVNTHGSKWALLNAPVASTQTKTDAAGHFVLTPGAPANVEAVQGEDVKAIVLGVVDTAGLTLQLAPTGSITGNVTAPAAASVTDFEGVDVFIPGSSYVAKADHAGHFTLDHVSVGSFTVVASKPDLGRAQATGVVVTSKSTTNAPDLALAVEVPAIRSISPAAGGVGTEVTITGDHFGATTGKSIQVSFGGGLAPDPTRVDDRTLKVKVPAAAASGPVVVTVGGIPGAGVSFVLPKTLSLAGNPPALVVGDVVPFKAVVTDETGRNVPAAPITWTITGDGATVDANGVVTASKVGKVVLNATAGAVTDRWAFDVATSVTLVSTFAGGGVGDHVDGAGTLARFKLPNALAFDAKGTLYVADADDNTIRAISPAGVVSTLAGTRATGSIDGPGAVAQFNNPRGIAVDAAGDVWVADTGNRLIRKIAMADPAHGVTTVSGKIATPAPAATPFGQFGPPGAGPIDRWVNGAAASATFVLPRALAFDTNGTLLIADNQDLRRLDPLTLTVSTFATSESIFPGWSVSSQPNIDSGMLSLVPARGGGAFVGLGSWVTPIGMVKKVAPDGKSATLLAGNDLMKLNSDGSGNPTSFDNPAGMVMAPNGDLIVTLTISNRVIRIDKDGNVGPLAGTASNSLAMPAPLRVDGLGTSAQFWAPTGLAMAADGSIYVADRGFHCIRKVVTRSAP